MGFASRFRSSLTYPIAATLVLVTVVPMVSVGLLLISYNRTHLETVEKRLHSIKRASKLDKTLAAESEALQLAYDSLSEGLPLYRAGLKDDVRESLEQYYLLTNRRVLAVVNVGEDDIESIPEKEALISAEFNNAGDNVEVIGMCIQMEAEAAAISDPEERKEILEGFGLGEGALFRMVRSAYHLLGLRTYLTTGEQESRAWTFHEGSTAPVCAGRIHGDFQRGFIKAEVIQWDELLELGSWNAAKDVGKMRMEGKDYIAQDGDVMEFRFNV
jgi:ribosome-binding ATPase YchF (GTP1/OBG family)